jgi:hypothetical protein
MAITQLIHLFPMLLECQLRILEIKTIHDGQMKYKIYQTRVLFQLLFHFGIKFFKNTLRASDGCIFHFSSIFNLLLFLDQKLNTKQRLRCKI